MPHPEIERSAGPFPACTALWMPRLPLPGWRAGSQAGEGPDDLLSSAHTSRPGFEVIVLTKKCRIQLGGPGSLQLTVMLLLEHPQFLGHRKEPSWVLAPQPRRCLHRPSSPQQLYAERTWVCKCCVPNSSPSSVQGLLVPMPVVPGALRHPMFD